MSWIVEHQQFLITILSSGFIMGGVVFIWLSQKARFQQRQWELQLENTQQLNQQHVDQLSRELAQAQSELNELDQERDKAAFELQQVHGKWAATVEKLRYFEEVKRERHEYMEELALLREQNAKLDSKNREQQARFDLQLESSQEKLLLLENAEERLKQQFEHLANQLFEVKTAKVDQQNKQSLDGLLTPLKEQIEGFKKQVNDNFSHEAKERHTLVHELKNLQRLNEQMSKEALNLTQALKGDNKQQGNWGEVVLARVLAESGLREGHEYHTQVSLQDEAGKRYQPDVIVNLPHDKQVVIDSKMALLAYERYFHAETNQQKEKALNDHILALRAHIKGLSLKDYHKLKGISSLNYVLMFIPVEPAFQVAIQAAPNLVKEAMENNIILVSPTTLLVALRTIDNLWRNDKQNHNAKVIANKASKLYDKLRLFVDDMEQLGASLEKANQYHQGAMNKLTTGRGNVIGQAESFKELGVEVKRSISSKWADASQQNALVENAAITERQEAEDKVN
ncbi:DNA recombination protein RmuC [Vibrio sp. RC27]